jgi:hypothetical protein
MKMNFPSEEERQLQNITQFYIRCDEPQQIRVLVLAVLLSVQPWLLPSVSAVFATLHSLT